MTIQSSLTVNILDEVSIQSKAILTNRTTSDGRPIYLVNRTITGEPTHENWEHISTFIKFGLGFIMEWLPATMDPYIGQLIAINKGKEDEFSIRIEDVREISVLKQRMVVNLPKAEQDVIFELEEDPITNKGKLWQYGLSYDGTVFKFYFNCTAQLADAERVQGFFITNTSVIEIGDPRGTSFLVCIDLLVCINVVKICANTLCGRIKGNHRNTNVMYL